jgi:succinate dehydrogenase/fumarate reductase-like Fe-S protein
MSDPVTESGQTAPITIQRGAPGEEPRMENYDVPWRAGMSVLDAVVWIRTHVDSSLAFRYSCVNANACKECMVSVNGKTEYACTARLSAEGTVVGPLTNKTLIRDLVTDIVPPKENLRTILKEQSQKDQ